MTAIRRIIFLVGCLLALISTVKTPAKAENVLIFAASSLTSPLQEFADQYNARTGDRIRTAFAASSTLARQISQGAPAAIYLSANQKWMGYLVDQNLLLPGSRRDLFSNRLVLITPSAAPKITALTPQNLNLLLSDRRLAIADPAHVPAGIYGVQALKFLTLWTMVKDRLAPMANVRAALALVERGESSGGIVYATDAHMNAKVRQVYSFPNASHDPIVYPSALIKHPDSTIISKSAFATARQFYDQLSGPMAKSIFTRHGFLVK